MRAARLHRVRVGPGGVCAAVGWVPGQGAGFGLGDGPAVGLLDVVVGPAQRRQVAFASLAALVVRLGVVEVALVGGASAAGEGTPALPGADQGAEPAAGLVAGFLPAVDAA